MFYVEKETYNKLLMVNNKSESINYFNLQLKKILCIKMIHI